MKEKIKKLNEVKKIFLLSGPFKKDVFVQALKECDIKMADYVFTEMLKQNIIIKQKGFRYFFKDDKPIYIGTLEEIIKNARKRKAKETYNYDHKKKQEEAVIVFTPEMEIQRAIQLLKNNGYKIFKPTITYEEI